MSNYQEFAQRSPSNPQQYIPTACTRSVWQIIRANNDTKCQERVAKDARSTNTHTHGDERGEVPVSAANERRIDTSWLSPWASRQAATGLYHGDTTWMVGTLTQGSFPSMIPWKEFNTEGKILGKSYPVVRAKLRNCQSNLYVYAILLWYFDNKFYKNIL